MCICVIRVLTTPRRVRPECSVTLREAHTTSPRSLTDGLLLRLHAKCVGAGFAPAPFGGPSGIRTHDLLNAIETRSQLRYRPKLACGPGGIRTPDLLSAIEARSQLRYRPNEATEIVPDSMRCVKQPTNRAAQKLRAETEQLILTACELNSNTLPWPPSSLPPFYSACKECCLHPLQLLPQTASLFALTNHAGRSAHSP